MNGAPPVGSVPQRSVVRFVSCAKLEVRVARNANPKRAIRPSRVFNGGAPPEKRIQNRIVHNSDLSERDIAVVNSLMSSDFGWHALKLCEGRGEIATHALRRLRACHMPFQI